MVEEIQNSLITKFIGRKIIYFNQIDSTQKEAKRQISDSKEIVNGTIILANNQTAGIGTKDREWYTGEDNNIAMTLILFPNSNIQNFKDITIIIAECIVKTIYNLYGYKLKIKEPNDIILNNKKLGGILTESQTINTLTKYILIGIGLNINQLIFPENIKEIATSLAIEFNKRYSREQIISEFCNIFEEEYLKLIN